MKLLVAYIPTAGGADAVALGACLARTLDADLQICVVVPPEPSAVGDDGQRSEIEHLSGALDTAARGWLADALTMVGDGVGAGTAIAVHPNPAEGIITHARTIDADMIAMGGSGGGILGRHTLGTVVNDILHSSPLPVALAPLGFAHVGAREVRELTVTIGHRPGTELLFSTALRSGARAHRPIRLVSLVALDEVQPWNPHPEDVALADARNHAQATLDEARQRLPPDFPITSTVVEGHTIEAAVASLPWHDGDLIMVGSSRLAAPNTIFLGTTAAKILRTLAVPMVVVPRADPAD
ncbi:MAG: universal stress protein [Gordonia sp. (in: high G+C Gram-positive bacteria)]